MFISSASPVGHRGHSSAALTGHPATAGTHHVCTPTIPSGSPLHLTFLSHSWESLSHSTAQTPLVLDAHLAEKCRLPVHGRLSPALQGHNPTKNPQGRKQSMPEQAQPVMLAYIKGHLPPGSPPGHLLPSPAQEWKCKMTNPGPVGLSQSINISHTVTSTTDSTEMTTPTKFNIFFQLNGKASGQLLSRYKATKSYPTVLQERYWKSMKLL